MSEAELYVVKQGDTFLARFRLRKRGQRTPWNVAGATITLQWWREGVAGVPVAADPGHPESSWTQGYVPILIGPLDLTELAFSVSAIIRVQLGGEDIALPHDGHILFDIQPRGETP